MSRAIPWRTLGTILIGALMITVVQAQSIRENLFGEATAALEAAKADQADLLAPRNFGRGMDFFSSAEENFERGRDLKSIKSDLAHAIASFREAVKVSKVVGVSLESLVKTRADAIAAGAANATPKLWQEAEQEFRELATDVERGRTKISEQKLANAEAAYRDAELTAIKATYLSETRQLLRRAEEQRVERHAPRTLSKAQRLLQEAEQELNQNRYDTDRARALAQQAKYEANHALYLASQLAGIRTKEITAEDIVLDWEKPIQRIAGATDMAARFDAGYLKPTQDVISYIEELQKKNRNLEQDLIDRDQQISQMEVEIADLEQLLGGVSQERVALSKQLEAQAIARQKFVQVEELFSGDESEIFRVSNDVVMRLVGLSFDSGQSEIKPESFELLSKVQSAIRVFPRSEIIIEGHTDSFGGDNNNLRLSEDRAEAVRQYLLANMNINPGKIRAVGYGETRPIANNETPVGRAKNRRIDVVIIPTVHDIG